MLNREVLSNLKQEEFELLMDFAGDELLRFILIQKARSLPKNSKYYLDDKSKGAFWKGFRTERIPTDRVRRFYIEEVYKNDSKYSIDGFLNDVLKVKILELEDNLREHTEKTLDEAVNLDANPERILVIQDMKIVELYRRLYELNIDSQALNKLEKDLGIQAQLDAALAKQAAEYEEIINKKDSEYQAQLLKLNKRLEALNKRLEKRDNEMTKANNKYSELEATIPNLLDQKIREIFKPYASIEAMSLFNELNIYNEDSAILALRATNEEAHKLIINKRYTNLENKIMLEYLILKMLEAKKENI